MDARDIARRSVLVVAAVAVSACDLRPEPLPSCGPAALGDEGIAVRRHAIVASYPHDPTAFTQGLLYAEGAIYESTGLYGESTLRRVNLETGAVDQQVPLSDDLWGEGLAAWDDRLIQLTWQAGRALVYDRDDFDVVAEHAYPTEGWGLTTLDDELVMSDGTSTLYVLDPETFEERRRIVVVSGGTPVVRLNELEHINGEIWANVWQTERIARIDPETGVVRGWVLLDGLGDSVGVTDPEDVLNGIAFDDEGCRLFVTGKRWPALFEIEVR